MFLVNSLLVALSLTLTIAPSHASEDAQVVETNPQVTYQARLLSKNTTTLRGVLNITGGSEGVGVDVDLDFWGFPNPYKGPYAYHIHVGRVPDDGNCTAALGHLDPYNRGMTTPCNDSAPETCQIGDLSGKYGSINSTAGEHYKDNYTDDYLSTTPGDPAFFGNLSFVVHAADDTRLNCGNFHQVVSASTPTPAPTPSTTPSRQPSASFPIATTSSPPLFVGAASSVGGASPVALFMALAAFFL